MQEQSANLAGGEPEGVHRASARFSALLRGEVKSLEAWSARW